MLRLRLYGSFSLKDKRRVLASIITRVQAKFGVSCAEVALNDVWDLAEIGLASVSSSAEHARRMLEQAVSFIEENLDGEVLDYHMDIFRISAG